MTDSNSILQRELWLKRGVEVEAHTFLYENIAATLSFVSVCVFAEQIRRERNNVDEEKGDKVASARPENRSRSHRPRPTSDRFSYPIGYSSLGSN